MKILFLNPKINAKHEISKSLLQKGVALLFPETADDGLQMLEFHGDTIDLAIIHREGPGGKGDPGLRFVEKLKLNSSHKDLPLILTSEVWNDADCASHQNGPLGANAYLHSPFSEKELVDICVAVLGQPLFSKATNPAKPSPHKGSSAHPILEETSQVFGKSDFKESASGISIDLEAFGLEPLPAPPSQPAFEAGNEQSLVQSHSIESSSSEQPGLEIGGFEPSEAPDMSEGSLQTSGPSEISMAPDLMESPDAIEAPDSIELSDSIEQQENETPPEFEELPQELVSSELLDVGSMNDIPDRSEITSDLGIPTFQATEPENQGSAIDSQVAEEMPYLTRGYSNRNRPAFDPSLIFAEPLGDAVVPGGAAQAPDLETFKKYLMLREQDVAVLSNQLKAAHDQLAASEQLLKEERIKQAELNYFGSEQKKKIEDFEKEKNITLDHLRTEVDDLTFQLRAKTDKSRILERQVREAVEEMEHLKTRVRTDIRKIRVREKELENRLEMTK
ncbi:MAG: hypothetical protein ABIQ95_05095, partial [Bdellovibrionia bacterium]